jgi:hypothetical protein
LLSAACGTEFPIACGDCAATHPAADDAKSWFGVDSSAGASKGQLEFDPVEAIEEEHEGTGEEGADRGEGHQQTEGVGDEGADHGQGHQMDYVMENAAADVDARAAADVDAHRRS